MSELPARLLAALEGRYTIERELGEGGMAIVYLAEDVRHHRKVALKVLRPELAAVVGGKRFLSEIQTTANLQHPHILPLFDSGEADSFLFYVMPFVKGESLADRLSREKQLPIAEAVSIARAVGSALDYAHRQGVIHRDIKPANILLHDGQAVVADFGIALAVQQAGGGRLTETGLSMGTPFYMSPEQATADREPAPSSDIYSLGCVLYEMLTGEPPFSGSSAQAVLGRMLTVEPAPPTELRKAVPPVVEAAVLRALEKLPADRFATAAEFVQALDDKGTETSRQLARSRRGIPTRRFRLWGAVATVAGVGVFVAVFWSLRASYVSTDAPAVRLNAELPPGLLLYPFGIDISDDGRQLLVVADEGVSWTVLRRPLDRFEFERVPGGEGAFYPRFSADGKWITFATRPSPLKRIPVEGGPAQTLDSLAGWDGADWSEDGTLVYTRTYQSGIWLTRVGGAPEMITEPDTAQGELAHFWPQLLPDGEHVLFTVYRTGVERAQIDVVSLRTRLRQKILDGCLSARYVATGHILCARNEVLFATPFDVRRLAVTGDQVAVVDDLAILHADGFAAFDVSDTGTLAYLPASEFNAPTQLVWVDREGREESIRVASGLYAQPALSSDGRSLSLTVTEPGQASDVRVLDVERGTLASITAGGGSDFGAIWWGDRVIYVAEKRIFEIYSRPADARLPGELLIAGDVDHVPASLSSDGRSFLYEARGVQETQIWSLPLAGGGAPVRVDAPPTVVTPDLSPDGKWLAYTSPEAGRQEVHVASYPDPSIRRVRVSTDGGLHPLWTRGGKELVFRRSGQFLSVTFDPVTGSVGTPEVLFEGPYVSLRNARNYDVTSDGERFVVVKRPEGTAPRHVRIVTNFFEELRRLGTQ